ncbi:DUF2690 domain-containing protein [Streptomyces sp. ISL-12]|uniref:DUF2690 domain-containing protein n=1 Tax=Streptomyces sp. ISL-12 TaxID=2819177 RepID=UPI001BED351F|nr:DUF2690 domain-containing protein [Streptomyces sp. ISL-12]MBT2409866.1 DUF2690 domain-containing protein [Streptomyces sp. ISL-12]
MTTSSTDNSSATSPEPATQPSDPRPEGGRRWNSATTVAYAVAIVSAVAAAVLSPLGEHVINTFLAEPACPGEACDGKNPGKQGCDGDARTFEPAAGNPAELQLRYSEECQAVWAKIERGSKGDLVTVEAAGGAERAAEIDYGDDQYTHMVRVGDGEFEVTACAVPKPGGKSTYDYYCVHGTEATAWQ